MNGSTDKMSKQAQPLNNTRLYNIILRKITRISDDFKSIIKIIFLVLTIDLNNNRV